MLTLVHGWMIFKPYNPVFHQPERSGGKLCYMANYMRLATMKRRGIKDTEANRRLLESLGLSFIINEKRKRVFIKVSNSDFALIKELIEDG